jgi:hypothetical protein
MLFVSLQLSIRAGVGRGQCHRLDNLKICSENESENFRDFPLKKVVACKL